MGIRQLKYFFLGVLLFSIVFPSSGRKSHSSELLNRGRTIPIALSENFLVTARTFSTLIPRTVDIYDLYNGIGSLQKTAEITAPYPSVGDDFGFSIALHEDYLLIGAPGSNNGHGAAYLYHKNYAGNWALIKTYENPNQEVFQKYSQKFGYSVALNDKYIVIGSPFYNDGNVFIYDFNPETQDFAYQNTPFETIDVRNLGDVEGCYEVGPDKFGFGLSLSFNNNKLLIGSLKNFVYLTEFKNGIISGTEIKVPETEGEQESFDSGFGKSVHVSNSALYVSALGSDEGRGKVFVYPYSDSSNKTDENPWTNYYTIQPQDLSNNSHFGYQISEMDNHLAITTFNQSKVYQYTRNEKNNRFDLNQTITNDEYNKSDHFGRNIALLDDGFITDAYYADELILYNDINRGSINSLSTKAEVSSIKNKIECTGGVAGSYECNEVDLMAYMDKTDIGGSNNTSLNDIWGWTDPTTQKEYALVGLSNGTSFVDISDAENPVYLGRLPTHTNNSTWRDIKVYNNHAFIVSEASGHGMQVFDLTELRNVTNSPVQFTATAHYSQFGNAHNIFINEDTGFAYAVGTSTCGPGGLHIIDISNPVAPAKAACVSDPSTGRSGTGYVHDVQCVVYNGPDTEHVGKEICVGSNETNVWVADLSTKSDDSSGAKTIGLGSYDDYYTHQGWLTEDHRYFIQNDELDENNGAVNSTRTLIWDLEDLDNPTIESTYFGPTPSIDHNNYVIGNYVYMSHYTSGLRILDITDISNPSEAAFFDVYPNNNNTSFDGTWSNYPYYGSGNVVVTSIDEGLFVLRPTFNINQPSVPTGISYTIPTDGTVTFSWNIGGDSSINFRIYRGEEPGFTTSSSSLVAELAYPTSTYSDTNLDTSKTYYYKLSAVNSDGIESSLSSEFKIRPLTYINAPPTIDAIASVEINEDNSTSVNLTGISYGGDANSQDIEVLAYTSETNIFSELNVDYNSPSSTGSLDLIPDANANGLSTIYVTVKDNGGTENDGIDSVRVAFNVNVLPINDSPGSFAVTGEQIISSSQFLTNDYLFITPENQSDSLRFVWNPSVDVDGDIVQYRMIGYEDLEFLTMNSWINETSIAWSINDLAAQTDTVNVSEGSWSILATDGESFKNATSGTIGNLKIDARALVPDVFDLKQNYPNPFNTSTTIEYDVPEAQQIVIRIFNVRGHLVRTLVEEEQSPGYKLIVWDGTNDDGDQVSSGIYFCQMYTPSNPNGGRFVRTKKMLRLR
ncbi:MAG: choice-of-anchor B family protein [Candidatus Neomarinimicrobiota bacterium]|nr:choice-of-anchor B family protein [Candidatus Neomarinimicrobiota bacterium]